MYLQMCRPIVDTFVDTFLGPKCIDKCIDTWSTHMSIQFWARDLMLSWLFGWGSMPGSLAPKPTEHTSLPSRKRKSMFVSISGSSGQPGYVRAFVMFSKSDGWGPSETCLKHVAWGNPQPEKAQPLFSVRWDWLQRKARVRSARTFETQSLHVETLTNEQIVWNVGVPGGSCEPFFAAVRSWVCLRKPSWVWKFQVAHFQTSVFIPNPEPDG